jgi:large subunit ribosomal protein L3
MQPTLFAKKIGMAQAFSELGTAFPVTILQTGVCKVRQVKTLNSDGYSAIQVAYGEETRPSLGEFRLANSQDYKPGQTLDLSTLSKGQKLKVTGRSIGKGFTGTHKRHNFTRGPRTHGSKNHRLPGSIGAGTTPGRVFPGKKMAGRCGGMSVTVKNVEVVHTDPSRNVVVIRGSTPGKRNTWVKIQAV